VSNLTETPQQEPRPERAGDVTCAAEIFPGMTGTPGPAARQLPKISGQERVHPTGVFLLT